ncbi:hypothetical protein E2C01_002590 [Portunus trituberculatus]|uniref:Uncharacterized protein n=1 Tax=Portunus trituberculatus TaxID=210409 RepID=A0A5B7CKS4_PORTR|nr:hypothetical protein [Portunus trituberculatus]
MEERDGGGNVGMETDEAVGEPGDGGIQQRISEFRDCPSSEIRYDKKQPSTGGGYFFFFFLQHAKLKRSQEEEEAAKSPESPPSVADPIISALFYGCHRYRTFCSDHQCISKAELFS